MIKTISLILFVLLISSCKKTTTGSNQKEAPRLVKTKVEYGRDVYWNAIDYDAEGRIVRITRSVNAQIQTYTYNITYSGNEVLIEHSLPISSGFYTREVIKYTLDGNRQPVIRTKSLVEELGPNPSAQKYQLYTDTAYFQYNSEGLLLKKEGTHYDSVWQKISVVETFVKTQSFKADYVNANKNVSRIDEEVKTIQRFDTYQSPQSTAKNSFSFDYSRAETNKVDSKNAFLYEDFDIRPSLYSTFNKNYSNIPNKITQTAGSSPYELSIMYDNDGNIIKIDEKLPAQTVKREFIYN